MIKVTANIKSQLEQDIKHEMLVHEVSEDDLIYIIKGSVLEVYKFDETFKNLIFAVSMGKYCMLEYAFEK